MGSFCCCPCGDEYEDYPSNSIYRHCVCLRFFFHQLFSGYGAMFHRIEGRLASSSIQGADLASSGFATAQPDSSFSDARNIVSRPLPYDADQRYSRLQRDGLVSRRDKPMTHFQEGSQQLRRNMSSSGVESLGSGKKWNAVDSAEGLKLGHSGSSEKELATKVAHGLLYIQPSGEDEDVCPTCLDEYTPENPKITAKCSHHFHLGCIYEWMERSDSCPICGKFLWIGQGEQILYSMELPRMPLHEDERYFFISAVRRWNFAKALEVREEVDFKESEQTYREVETT